MEDLTPHANDGGCLHVNTAHYDHSSLFLNQSSLELHTSLTTAIVLPFNIKEHPFNRSPGPLKEV